MRTGVLVAVVLVALVAGIVANREGSRPRVAAGADDTAAADLVRWVEAEVPAGTPVVAADDVLVAVSAAGGDERFLPLEDEVPGALLVLRGEQPAGSVALARFGKREAGALTLVDPSPGQPTPEQLARRQRLAAAILANPSTGATGRAADVLRSAAVDARLLGLLAALVAQLGVGIGDFPPPPGELGPGPLARSVVIDRVGTATISPGASATDRLVDFVEAQLPPFAADTVEVTDGGVLVQFRYESSPDAVVEENTP